MKKESGEKKTDFWNDHSLEFLEMAMRRDYQETVHPGACDGYGKSTREGCGDTIEFFVKSKGDRFDSISYDLNGCIFSHACVNALIHLVEDKTIEEAVKLTPRDIISFLKTLPAKEEHCAGHALRAFYSALEDIKKQ